MGGLLGKDMAYIFICFFARCINICINKCATRISRKQQLAVFVMLIIHIANVKNSTLIDSTMYFYNDTISCMSNDILKIRMAVTGQAVDLTASWIRDITWNWVIQFFITIWVIHIHSSQVNYRNENFVRILMITIHERDKKHKKELLNDIF